MQVWEFLNWSLLSGALDVVLVYVLIYRLLLLVRGTRAEPMLLGLGIIVLVYIVSRELNLATLNWILGNFLGSVILVIVVLFQDDLRRALTKVGLFPGFGAGAPEALERSIKEISQAAGELSSRRIGGLIVIRRDVGLEDYTEHAVRLDAAVSHQLLVSVFLPTSPLHDGAVVVEGDRIVAAGAVLPLTFNPSISSSFGTRHRAAIGLSERTDAVMVVVSEETGGISLIREGRMTKDLNEKTLYNALHRLTVFRHQRAQRRKERRKTLLGRDVPPGTEGAARLSALEGPPLTNGVPRSDTEETAPPAEPPRTGEPQGDFELSADDSDTGSSVTRTTTQSGRDPGVRDE